MPEQRNMDIEVVQLLFLNFSFTRSIIFPQFLRRQIHQFCRSTFKPIPCAQKAEFSYQMFHPVPQYGDLVREVA